MDGLTQTPRLAEAGQMARELVALERNVPIEQVEVQVTVATVDGIDVTAELETIRRERAEAAELERNASARASALARELASRRLPVRDIGTILGVSHQRAHQLVARR